MTIFVSPIPETPLFLFTVIDEAWIGWKATDLTIRHNPILYSHFLVNRKVYKGNNTNNNTMENTIQEQQELADINLEYLLKGKQRQNAIMQEIANEW